MSTSILPFAENLIHHHNDDNDYSFDFLLDEQAFPPLSSTNAGFEVIRDEVLFTDENTVWVNTLSYTEAAENGGVVHEPISIDISYDFPPASYKHHAHTPKAPAVGDSYYGDDDDNCMDTLYYDTKSLSADKATAENTVYARKLKTAKYIYQRNLRKNLQKLPDFSNDMTEEDAKKVREAKALVSGCDKVIAYEESFLSKYSYYRDRFYNRVQVKDWHKICRRRTLQEFKNDPIVARLDDEYEAYAFRELRYQWDRNHRLASCRWDYYYYIRHLGFTGIRMRYNDIIEKAKGVDPNISKKEGLYLIRSAIPEKKYIGPKVTRTQCAYMILDELHH